MKSKNYKLLLAAGLVSALLLGLLTEALSGSIFSAHRYDTLAAIVSKISVANPELEEVVVQSIKSPFSSDIKSGYDILQSYGYTRYFFDARDNLRLIFFVIIVCLVIYSTTAILTYALLKSNRKRIIGLTNYLNLINTGKDNILPSSSEDDFSCLEDELYKTVTELKQTREQAVKARKALADNMADISHQLKTPITSISLMTELLLDRKNNSEDFEYIERISNQVNKLQKLTGSLLTLSRLDAGTIELKKQKVDVLSLISAAVDSISEITGHKHQTVNFNNIQNVSFMGDFSWSIEALINIIKNCAEHTPDNGTITISYEQNPIYTQIVIEDNGEGIDKEDLPHIFERFYKGKNTGKETGKESIGIGLALSKAIIEKQNGIIHVENCLNCGARFIVKFYNHRIAS